MKKTKRLGTIFLSAVIAAVGACSPLASYATGYHGYFDDTHEGMIKIDDNGLFAYVNRDIQNFELSDYSVYCTENGKGITICSGYGYSCIEVIVPQNADYTSIIEPYAALFDYYEEELWDYNDADGNFNMGVRIGMCLKYECDADGNHIEPSAEQVENQYSIILSLCRELYDAGILVDALYKPAVDQENSFPFEMVSIGNTVLTEEELTAILDEGEYTYNYTYGYSYYLCQSNKEDTWLVYGLENVYEALAFQKAVLAADPEAVVHGDGLQPDDAGDVWETPNSVNLLELLENTSYGDLSETGSVSLSDVVLINRAINGDITLSEQAKMNADCNADGVLDSEDAVILLKFLVRLVPELPYQG